MDLSQQFTKNDFTNITTDAKKVITDLTDVQAGNNISVSSTTDDATGKKTYTIEATANGTVTDGNTGLVNGGTVYDAIKANQYNEANGITVDNDKHTIAVKLQENKGLKVDATGLAIKTNDNSGLKLDTNGISVKTGDASGLQVNRNGVAVKAKANGGITIDSDGLSVDTAAIKSAVDTNTVTTVQNAADDSSIEINETVGTDGNVAYTLKATAGGAVADGVHASTSGDTVYHEVRPSKDGNYVKTGSTTGDNLLALDKQVKTNADNITKNAGDITTINNTLNGGLNFTGDDATATVNKKLGDTLSITGGATGELADGNIGVVKDGDNLKVKLAKSVTGLTKVASTTVDATTVNSTTVNATDVKTTNVDASTKITVGGENGVTINGDSITNVTKVTNNNDVTNKQYVDNLVTSHDYSAGDGISISDDRKISAVAKTDGGLDVTADGIGVKVNAATSALTTDADGLKVKTKTNGGISIGSDGLYIDKDAIKSDIDTNTVTTVEAGDNLSLTDNGENGNHAYKLSVTTNGGIASGNTGIVTGGTVYTEVRPNQDGNYVKTDSTTGDNLLALDKQVKTNAGNITKNAGDITTINNTLDGGLNFTGDDATATVNKKLGETLTIKGGATELADNNIGVVKGDDGSLQVKLAKSVTGLTKVESTTVDATTVNAMDVKTTNVDASTKITVGTGDTKVTINGDSINNITKVENNTDAANKEYVDNQISGHSYTAGNGISITNPTDNSNHKVISVKTADDATAGTYSGLSATEDGLKVKTKTDGGITVDENGLSVNTEAIKSAIDTNTVTTVEGDGTTAKVEDSATDGNHAYKVSVLTNGKVASGNTGVVSGGTLYNEVHATPAEGQTFKYISETNTAGANLAALDKQVGTNADNIATNTQNITDNASKITKNTTDIATNVTNIAKNAGDITTINETLGKGLDFTGDDANTKVNKKLGETLTIKGDGNTSVVKDGDGLQVQLSKTLTGLTSITSTTVNATDVKTTNVDASKKITVGDTTNSTTIEGDKIVVDNGVTINKNSINNVTTVTNDNDVTNKKYVDDTVKAHDYTAGNGISISDDRKISAVAKADSGVEVTADGIGVKTGTTSGLKVDSTGLAVKAKADGGITIDENGLSVNTEAIKSAIDTNTVTTVKGDNSLVTVTDEGMDGNHDYKVTVSTDGVKGLAKDAISITGDDNIKVTQDKDDKGKYTLKLGDVLNIGSTHAVSVNGNEGTVTGLTNKTWVVGTTKAVSGRAATEDQLQAVSDAVKTQQDNLGKATFGLSDGKNTTTAKLGSTIAVTGDSNITTKAGDKGMEISLNKDVDVNSVTTGNTKVDTNGVSINNGDIKVTKDGLTIKDGPSVTKNGIDAGSKQITNVASGGNVETNAANIGDVNRIAKEEAKNASEGVRAKSGTNITVKSDNTVNLNDSIQLNGTVTGLTNKDWKVGETKAVSGQAATEDQLQKVSDVVAKGTNFAGDSGKAVNVKLGETLAIKGGITDAKKLSEGNIGVVAENGALNVKLAKDITLNNGSTTYEAGTNLKLQNGGTVNAVTVVNSAGVVTALTDDKGKAVTNPVSLTPVGLDNGGNQIHHVAPGTAADDAATVGQLAATNNSVNQLGNRIDKVGAGAAALAGLHPLDFDPDDKWDFAGGYGHYRGTNAAAIGAFYRPDEDTMFSIGGSAGAGENLINVGVTFKLGRHNHVSTSRTKMAKEIRTLQQENTSLHAENEDLKARMSVMEGQIQALLKAAGLAEK